MIILGGNTIGRTLVGVSLVAEVLLQAGIVFRLFVCLYLNKMDKFVNDSERKCLDAFVVFDIDANQFFIDKVAAVFFPVRVVRYLNIWLILFVANMMNAPLYNGIDKFWLTDFRLECIVGYWGYNRW